MSSILRSSFTLSRGKSCIVVPKIQSRIVLKSNLESAPRPVLQSNRYCVTSNVNKVISSLISTMNRNAKKSRRLSFEEVQIVLEAVKAFRAVSANQSIILIRCCGNLLVQERPETRVALAREIWNTLESIGTKLDVRHYNALLTVYLENHHVYDSSEILASMKGSGIEPNRGTFERLLRSHCQRGDMNGAVDIVKMLREKLIPLDVSFFNAFIIGLSQMNNDECVEDILDVLEEWRIVPSSETLSNLICTNIEAGNLTNVLTLWRLCDQHRIVLKRKQYFDIVYTYATCRFDDEIKKVLSRIKRTLTYDQDAVNLSLKLITAGMHEAAFEVLKSTDENVWSLQNLFIAHLARCCESLQFVTKCCTSLLRERLNPHTFNVAMETCLRCGKEKIALGLFHEARANDVPVRYHYFWPLLVCRGKRNDITGLLDILSVMVENFGLSPNLETIEKYVLPYMLSENNDVEVTLSDLKARGIDADIVTSSLVLYWLMKGKIREAASIARCYQTYYPPFIFRKPLVNSYFKCEDIDSFVTILNGIISGVQRKAINIDLRCDEDAERGIPDHREYAGLVVKDIAEDVILQKKSSKTFSHLLQSMLDREIGISVRSAEALQNILVDAYTFNMSDVLENLVLVKRSTPTSSEDIDPCSPVDVPSVNTLDFAMVGYDLSFWNTAAEDGARTIVKSNEKLEIKNIDFSHSAYARQINAFLGRGELHEAVEVYEEMCKKFPGINLHLVTILQFTWLLVQNGHYYQALEVLHRKLHRVPNEEMYDEETFVCNLLCWRILNFLAEEGSVQKVRECAALFLSGKLVQANDFLLTPLIKVHIVRHNLESALDEFAICVRRHSCMPWKKELSRHFIVTEDESSLSRLYDLTREVDGRSNTTYDILTNSWERSCIRRAKKILKTPNAELIGGKSKNLPEALTFNEAIKYLRNLLWMSQGIQEVDRSEIYHKILSIHDETNDYRRASSLWKRMQEENCHPSNEFLILLAGILSRNEIPIPFQVPQANDGV